MEPSQNQKVELLQQNPQIITDQCESANSEEPDTWFDSSDSQNSFQDEAYGKGREKQRLQAQKISKQAKFVGKNEKAQKSATEQEPSTNEREQIFSQEKDRLRHQKQKNYQESHYHIDQRIIRLLQKMIKFGLVNLLEIAQLHNQGTIEFVDWKNLLIFRAAEKAIADAAIIRVSNLVEKINVQKLGVGREWGLKLEKCRKLTGSLLKRGIVIFNIHSKNKNLQGCYIGGKFKRSQLQKFLPQIKSYKIFGIKLFRFRNSRSYRLILDQIFESESMIRYMTEEDDVSLMQVDVVNTDDQIHVLMDVQKSRGMQAKQYQERINKGIQMFFVSCFILSSQPYFEKLAVSDHPEIKFTYIKERNRSSRNISYLFIITEIETFFNHSKAIREQLEKVGKWIIGARFFHNLFPELKCFVFDPEYYYIRKFPKMNTYSMMVLAKEKGGIKFDWGQTFSLFESLKRVRKFAKIEEKESSEHKTP